MIETLKFPGKALRIFRRELLRRGNLCVAPSGSDREQDRTCNNTRGLDNAHFSLHAIRSPCMRAFLQLVAYLNDADNSCVHTDSIGWGIFQPAAVNDVSNTLHIWTSVAR